MTTEDGDSWSYRRWLRTGFRIGAAVGVVIALYLYWYFEHGPGLAIPDRADVHGFWIIALGAPFSWLMGFVPEFVPYPAVQLLIVLFVACSWGLFGTLVSAIAGVLVRRFRSAT